MTPDAIMRKIPFRRILPSDNAAPLTSGIARSAGMIEGNLSYEYPSYADFLREQDVNAHRIMSETWYPDVITYDEENKKYYKRKLARVTTNLPEVFASQRTSMLTGDHVDIKLCGGGTKAEQDLLARFINAWDYKDMEDAVYDIVWYSNIVADAAVLVYLDNGKVNWMSMSFKKGDVLYPHYDAHGRLCLFGRKYKLFNQETGIEDTYLDVWDNREYVRYRYGEKVGTKTAWVVDEGPVSHGFPRIPIAYNNSGDTVAGPAMGLLDTFDLSMSQLCENNKAFALRIFYALGADVEVHASVDGRPQQVTSSDPNARVGFLEPADSSGSFDTQMRQLIDAAYQAAHCTKPTEIKSGADISSLTVQMLSKDSYHQALLDAKRFQPAINDLVDLFKYGYSVEEGQASSYERLLVKGTICPYIMRSEVEEVNNISILKGAGAIPIKAAANEAARLGYGTPLNYDDILQEQHDELVAQQQVQTTPVNNPVNASRNA